MTMFIVGGDPDIAGYAAVCAGYPEGAGYHSAVESTMLSAYDRHAADHAAGEVMCVGAPEITPVVRYEHLDLLLPDGTAAELTCLLALPPAGRMNAARFLGRVLIALALHDLDPQDPLTGARLLALHRIATTARRARRPVAWG